MDKTRDSMISRREARGVHCWDTNQMHKENKLLWSTDGGEHFFIGLCGI